MAAKLETSATIHRLKPRKAKGAGGQKRKGPSTTRLKTTPAAAKPAQPTDADIRRNTQDRLVALHTQHRQAEHKIAAAQEVVSAAKTKKAEIRAAIQNTCVPLAIYDELHKKVTAKTKRADNELYEKQRAIAFEAFALPCGPTAELDLQGVADASRPALYWEEMGYHVAIDGAGQFADSQRDGVPPENVQDYMRGHQTGTARIGAGLKALKETAPAAAVQPAAMVGEDPAKAHAKQDAKGVARVRVAQGGFGPVVLKEEGQPDWSDFDNDPALWTDDQRVTFDAWYEGLDPDADVDIDHTGVEMAFDHRVDAETKAQAPAPADNFEAPAEEIASQTTRRVVQEQRAHAGPQFSDD